ncbi:MAG: hypothetical protein JRF37_07845 [Deltaproteobacteria bacterium]|nr:hypothetical protein [Deltaproteobacteria bacterium]
MLKPSIIGAGLGIFFFIAAHFFLTAYERCALIQDRLGVSIGQARLLKEHQKERTQKKRNLDRANRFVNRARSLGVEGDNWAYYDVNIEEPVSFAEAEKILRQTANSSSYYFKPVRLHVKTWVGSNTKGRRGKQGATFADSPETKQGDILLTLRGSFAVRRK